MTHQSLPQFRNGQSINGMTPVGIEVLPRIEHKAAIPDSRMRKLQYCAFYVVRTAGQQVEIECPGAPFHGAQALVIIFQLVQGA